MIRAADLWMIGLAAAPTRKSKATRRRGLEYVPTSGAAAPMREMGELFPRWRLEDAERDAEARGAAAAIPPKGRNDG